LLFGQVEIKVPRALLNTAGGKTCKTTEWWSRVQAYEQRIRAAHALIARA
jgi:hypothetical protein